MILSSFTINLKPQTGTASYYALKFNGRKTYSGEILHNDSLTAAHRTYPIGTLVKVTNLSNDSTIIVRINDRMGSSPHIIDLTQGGAKRLNFLGKGIAKVKLEVVQPEEKIQVPNPISVSDTLNYFQYEK